MCCIIRTKKAHPGVEAKRRWLSDRLREGHVFRKLNAKGVVFIEYAPLETAWVPVIGDNYYYIYCLWVAGPYKGKGYAKALMEHCLADARTHGKSGVCMLGAEKQKAWLSDQSFARKFGFEVVDTTDNGYELLALSFDGTTPQFAHNAKKQRIESQALTVYYDMQCPFIPGNLEMIRQHCEAHGVPADFIEVDTLRKAKELPCVRNGESAGRRGLGTDPEKVIPAGTVSLYRPSPRKNLRTLRRSGCSIPPVPALFCFFCPLFRDSFRIFVIRI